MGRIIMYAMMGAGTYGCSGVTTTVIARLWRVFALPKMLYGLETYRLQKFFDGVCGPNLEDPLPLIHIKATPENITYSYNLT